MSYGTQLAAANVVDTATLPFIPTDWDCKNERSQRWRFGRVILN